MIEQDLDKIAFMRQLNLVPVVPLVHENKSPKVLENHMLISSNSCTDLSVKNNSIVTGYENFCLEKDNVKLYPTKDFDFIDKNVVCQNCYQQFDSRLSYIAHVGTDICVKPCKEQNLMYLKTKKQRKCRQVRKKNKKKSMEDIHSYDLKKNLLNHEMLNTLQTRNKCYSDYVLSPPKIVRAKRGNSSKDNDEPLVKKPRGRPKKNIAAEPKKRGRPKKIKAQIANDETLFKTPLLVSNIDEPSNSNVKVGRKETLSVSMKNVTEKFWKIFNTDWKHDIEGNEKSFGHHNPMELPKEKNDSSIVKDIYLNLEGLKNDLKLLREQLLQGKNKRYKSQLESMLSKLEEKYSEFNYNELKKNDMENNLMTNKGKENIDHCLIENINDETLVDVNEIIDDDEKCIGKWLNNDMRDQVAPTISIIMNDGCETIKTNEYIEEEHFNDNLTIEYVNDEHFEEDMTIEYLNVDDLISKDSFEENLETLTNDINQNSSSLDHSDLNNDDLNYMYNPILGCKICGSCFVSIAEWKMHRSEHLALLENKNCLCKICGLKFKIFKNYLNHINTHSKIKQESPNIKDVNNIDTQHKSKKESEDTDKFLKKYTIKVCS
ncbi:uncharacterized protein LOC112681631 isoform X2 [Sipha flava]|nr:uncharacterized protein LOC112681631 isoform X2 [Sipha flava]XP_025407665.1 uncharacterized protein LOC112681631 isoform X2 [Sipha flava]XP_025407666.1 uncharacterized protein LOC112681631 isoform X2 [Sipha flava]